VHQAARTKLTRTHIASFLCACAHYLRIAALAHFPRGRARADAAVRRDAVTSRIAIIRRL